jgi:hypothetical protein
MTLGFNVSAAVVNFAQIPLVVGPYLGGKYGYPETMRALGRASRYIAGSGFKRKVEMLVPTDTGEKSVTSKAAPGIGNYEFGVKGDTNTPQHLKELVETATRRGQLNRSQAYDMLEMDDRDSIGSRVNRVSGFMFHHGERMNREIAMITSYELELQRLVGKDKKFSDATTAQKNAAADYAIEVTELTNGGTSAAAAPSLSQNAVGRVVFMYKRYGISMYYMMLKTAKEAYFTKKPKSMSDAEFKEFESAAKRQIAGVFASSALIAGVQGIPMLGIVAMLYNLILKGEDDDDMDTAARKYLGEGVYSGAVNALTGTNIASRVGLSDLLFRDTTTRPSDSVIASFIETMGGPVIGVTSRMIRGFEMAADGNVERGIEQMLPSAISNPMKAVRFHMEGAKTLRGDTVMEDIHEGHVLAQAFGFAPAEYIRQVEINSDLKSFERNALERRTELLRKYYVASRVGDDEGAEEIMDDMFKFNDRYPSNAITMKTINASMAQHRKTSQEMYHGITINKKMRDEIMGMAAEYDDDE